VFDPLPHLSLFALAFGAAAFFAGGFVKGVVGVGLPLIVVPLLALIVDPRLAIALMLVPILTSNLWQAFAGGGFRAALRRFGPLIASLGVCTFATSYLLVSAKADAVALFLGTLIVLYCVVEMLPVSLTVSPPLERRLTPAVGAVAGLMGGFSSFYGPPLLIYLSALKMPKDEFVTSIALLYFCGGAALYAGLAVQGVYTLESVVLSAAAALPVLLGVVVGQRLRAHVSQRNFERALWIVLFAIGVSLIAKVVS
jgi:uncharacterized membrane protein YfcA